MTTPICPRCKISTVRGMFPHPKYKFVCTNCHKKLLKPKTHFKGDLTKKVKRKLTTKTRVAKKLASGKTKFAKNPKVKRVIKKIQKKYLK